MSNVKNLTLDVLSKKCGVSIGTMHRYMHTPHLLKPTTRNKIKHIFKQDISLSQHENNRTIQSIALFCRDSQLLMTHDLIRAIQDVCSVFPDTVNIVLVDTKKVDELNTALIQNQHILHSVDAVIAFAFNITESYDEHIQAHKIPIVAINSRSCEYGVSYASNNYQGASDAVQHLLQSGYSRIGFIGWDIKDPHLIDRFNGWKSVCEYNNIEHTHDYAPLSPEGGYIAGKRMIKEFNPDAIFIACDAMALGTINYINDTKFKVGTDIGIMGFDDIYSANFIGLSTMHQLLYEKVSQIVQYICKFNIQEYTQSNTQKISFTPIVVARRSTQRNYNTEFNTGIENTNTEFNKKIGNEKK